MAIRVLAVGNNVTTQTDHRSLITSLVQSAGSTSLRAGLFPSTPLPASLVNVSAMTVGVGAFKALIFNSSGTGHYLVQSDANINLDFDPGEASVARTDRIIIRVYNDSQDGSGQEGVALEYLKGQSSGSASPLPQNSMLLWEVSVPAGASAGTGGINFVNTAVDRRFYTTASGGIIPLAHNGELSDISNPYEGMAGFTKNTDIFYIYDGTQWVAKGQISVATSAQLGNILNPWEGLLATARDTDVTYYYNGSTWNRLRDQMSAFQPVEAFTVSNDTTVSTSYFAGTNNGVAFTAPTSGKVYVTFEGWVGSNGTGNTPLTYMSDEIRTGGTVGSGSIVSGWAASDDRAIINPANDITGFSYGWGMLRHLVTGLTPGSQYNVRTVFRAVSSTAAVNKRRILVEPAQ